MNDPRFRSLLHEAGHGTLTVEFIEHGLRDEDLVVVPASKVYLRIRLPRWLVRKDRA